MFIDKRATAEKQLDAESLKSASIKRQIHMFSTNTMGEYNMNLNLSLNQF